MEFCEIWFYLISFKFKYPFKIPNLGYVLCLGWGTKFETKL
jgi:hypothetical protein